MTFRLYVITIWMLMLLMGSAQAFEKVGTTSFQFLKVMLSGRSTAMGEAYSASVFGADAVFWNPAALTTVRRLDAEFSYMDYFFDISHSSAALAYAVPGMGTFGFHALLTDVGDIEETTVEALGFRLDPSGSPVEPPRVMKNTSYATPTKVTLGPTWIEASSRETLTWCLRA